MKAADDLQIFTTSNRGIDYNLLDALKRNPLIIRAGDNISGKAHETIVHQRSTIARLESELKARESAGEVKVKPLMWWSPSEANNYTHGAETIFGTYYVGIDGGRHNAWIELFHEGRRPIEQWFGEDRGYLEAAKADAQKHYETRIRSALVQEEEG